MQKGIAALIFGSILLIIISGSAHAESFSVTTFNDSLSEKNITFLKPWSVVGVSLPKFSNITSAFLNVWGYNFSYNASCSSLYSSTPCGYATDESYGTAVRPQTNTEGVVLLNYTFLKPVTINYTFSVIGIPPPLYCRVSAWNFSTNNWSILNETTPCGTTTFTYIFVNIGSSGNIWGPYGDVRIKVAFNDVTSSFNYFYDDNVTAADTFTPRNITVDIGANGTLEYSNTTIYNTTERINLNKTAIESYLSTCTSDANGYCSVPINFTTAGHGASVLMLYDLDVDLISGFTINIFLYDEITGNPFNANLTNYTNIILDCDTYIRNVTITGTSFTIKTDCNAREIMIDILEDGSLISRTIIPPPTSEYNITFYVFNSTITNDAVQRWKIQDVTGTYRNGYVSVKKHTTSGEITVLKKYIDAESKIDFYQIIGETYCISVISADGNSESIIGCLKADTDTLKTLVVSSVPFYPVQDLTFRDVLISYQATKGAVPGTSSIITIYNDTTLTTISTEWHVYNASYPTQDICNGTSNTQYTTYICNGMNENYSYIVKLTSLTSKYGYLYFEQVIGFAPGIVIVGLEGTGIEPMLPISATLIVIFVMVSFGRRHAKEALAICIMLTGMFMYWGWFNNSPVYGWSMMILFLFIAGTFAMTDKRSGGT